MARVVKAMDFQFWSLEKPEIATGGSSSDPNIIYLDF